MSLVKKKFQIFYHKKKRKHEDRKKLLMNEHNQKISDNNGRKIDVVNVT